ncbi:hypothetical protein KJ891_01785 [Candidatus Micrarchaeota archaeon]|nr:hypothetical protein [Candidatus Micrarchaeota archaeon]
MKHTLSILAVLLLFCGGALGYVSDFPGNVTIGNTPAEINFDVVNGSTSGQKLEVEVFVPAGYKVEAPEFLGAGESTNVKITFAPDFEKRGSGYEATVVITLGKNQTERALNVYFEGSEKTGAVKGDEKAADSEGNEGQGFLGISGFVTGLENAFNGPATELMLDIVLVIIAAVLLIAFISRLTMRVATPTNIRRMPRARGGHALQPKNSKIEDLKERIAG